MNHGLSFLIIPALFGGVGACLVLLVEALFGKLRK